MKKIYLFRHGQTDDNLKDIICGSRNTPLNEVGKKQALISGKMLLNSGITCIYSSPLDRAVNTAEIVAKEINVNNIILIDGLRETDFGDLEGVERPENWTPINEKGEKDFICDIQYPNGESRHEARKRFSDAVLDICKNDKNDTVGVAAHGNVLRQFLIYFDFEDTSRLKNCEIIEAEFDGKNIKVMKRVCDNCLA